MKTLPISKIILDDSFLNENEDLLSDEFTWFYDIIKQDIIIKLDNVRWIGEKFIFNKDGQLLFYVKTHEKDFFLNRKLLSGLNISIATFYIDNQNIVSIIKYFLKEKFGFEVDYICVAMQGSIDCVEQHFKNR